MGSWRSPGRRDLWFSADSRRKVRLLIVRCAAGWLKVRIGCSMKAGADGHLVAGADLRAEDMARPFFPFFLSITACQVD